MSIATPPGRDALRVLLADRDPSIRAEFERVGERQGWRCSTVPDAAEILSALEREPFDILITDLVIPEMSAIELLQRLRGSAAGVEARRVIVLTARDCIANADALIRSGASDVVLSPVSVEAVRVAVERIATVLAEAEWKGGTRPNLPADRSLWELSSQDLASRKFTIPILDRLYHAGRVNKTEKLRLDLAFHEALLNALDHGNLELESAWREEFDERGTDRYERERAQRLTDPRYAARKILIETVLDGTRLTIRIRDEGRGFVPPSDIHPPTQPLCSGRGLAIIKGSVDEVHFAHDGTEITLTKFLPG